MKEIMISEFIDNELELSQKKRFVEEISKDKNFAEETIDMIEMEIFLRKKDEVSIPEIKFKNHIKSYNKLFYSLQLAVILIVGFVIFKSYNLQNNYHVINKRFVIYEPNAKVMHIVGSFTNWEKLKMKKIAGTGYWEVVLPIKKGEYRYNFIINNEKEIADPTAKLTEKDDFGGETSILHLET